MALYRDAHLGLRARLVELDARVRETESELTEAFWASLDSDVRERLARMRDALAIRRSAKREADTSEAPRGGALEELARAEGELAAYHEALERLVATLPALEEAWLEIPSETPDPPPQESHWSLERVRDEEAQAFTRALVTSVRERDRGAELFWSSATSCLARFTDQGIPFALRATAYPRGGNVGEVVMCLVTSIARATPELRVRPESLLSAFGKAIGLRHEQEVGDPSFDGLFLIEGSPLSVARLLPPSTRTSLLALARFDVPTLDVSPAQGVAQLRWDFEPTPRALDAAIRVLTSIRETRPVAVPLRR
jgi:hypothetical protein